MAEAAATENPACVKTNGRVIDANPLLIPEGRSRKKKRNGRIDSRLCMNELSQLLATY